MSGADVVNFGCRLNIAEGEAIRAATADLTGTMVFNTCVVTAEAERQARQAIRRAARAVPDRRIIVTGCGADVAGDRFAAMPEVSAIVGNQSKRDADAYRPGAALPPRLSTPAPLSPVTSGADHARAFVEVQNGCDHRCTFCIIPFGRGPSRSVPADLAVAAVAAAVARGHREVVLTGVDLTSYGHDLPGAPALGTLVAQILLQVPGLDRLRLSSLDSVEIDPLLFDIITSESRVMPHVHLSLQAGDDMILKRMKRRHSRADAVALVARLKQARHGIAIGADLIAGFPTENDAMFANTAALIDDCDIVLAHIFPFSARTGTPAARMPAVERETVRRRAAALRARAQDRRAAWLDRAIGTDVDMLVERDGLSGHAPDFATLRLDAPAPPGTIVRARITARDGAMLTATRATERIEG